MIFILPLFIGLRHTNIIIDVSSLTSLINSVLQRLLYLWISERDLFDFLSYEVGQNGDRFSIPPIYSELAATGILVHSDLRTSVGLSHYVEFLLDYVDAGSLYWVRIPQIDNIDNELRRNILE